MASKESQIAAQVRLSQWTQQIQDCQNRPKNMTVNEWCEQHNIKKASYYWRLKRVRQALLEQMEMPEAGFVELPIPSETNLPSVAAPEILRNSVSTAAVLHVTEGISIEIKESATADFIKNLFEAVIHA
uniref:IS66 family insertion sequence element accessory protein TnpA n=1 Tax=Agathobacter sp. TaxID=2021311 RepID=UPI004055CF3B